MAHSDVLIFLTNITWMFFIFLSTYFFFVLFFLPSFYKKLRLFLVNRTELSFLGVYFSSLLPAGTANGLFFFREFKTVFTKFCGLLLGLVTFVIRVCYSRIPFLAFSAKISSVPLAVYLVEGVATSLSFLIVSNTGFFASVLKR